MGKIMPTTGRKPVRVIVTGSREWTNKHEMRRVLGGLPLGSTVVHGGARGADSIADEVARELGLEVEVFPADWEQYGKRAGHIRNQQMVDAGADYCLAFPLPGSRGTYDMMERAERAGIFVSVFSV